MRVILKNLKTGHKTEITAHEIPTKSDTLVLEYQGAIEFYNKIHEYGKVCTIFGGDYQIFHTKKEAKK